MFQTIKVAAKKLCGIFFTSHPPSVEKSTIFFKIFPLCKYPDIIHHIMVTLCGNIITKRENVASNLRNLLPL